MKAIHWITRLLSAEDDSAGEAALAIAGTHSAEGFQALRDSLNNAHDPWFRAVLLSAIALTRQDEALDFLLNLVRTESLDGERAIEALMRSMPSENVIAELEKLVASNSRLARTYSALRKP